jgi:transposase
MMCWKLSDEQQKGLDALRSSTSDERVIRNVEVILMSGQGRSKEWLALEFGCSLGTVMNIRRGYRLRGLAGLKPRPRPGRRSRATPHYRARLRQVAHISPQNLGYAFRVWSAPRLAQHLEKETGIRFSEDQLRRILEQEGLPAPRRRRRRKDLVHAEATHNAAIPLLAELFTPLHTSAVQHN